MGKRTDDLLKRLKIALPDESWRAPFSDGLELLFEQLENASSVTEAFNVCLQITNKLNEFVTNGLILVPWRQDNQLLEWRAFSEVVYRLTGRTTCLSLRTYLSKVCEDSSSSRQYVVVSNAAWQTLDDLLRLIKEEYFSESLLGGSLLLDLLEAGMSQRRARLKLKHIAKECAQRVKMLYEAGFLFQSGKDHYGGTPILKNGKIIKS